MSNPQDTISVANPEGHDLSQAKMLSEIQQRLEATDEEIAGTFTHLHRLQARRMDILVEINSITSPILRLPPELLCEIFICCLPPRTLPSSRDAPLLLGQICRRWRSTAISLPGLWSSICVAAVLSAIPRIGLLSLLDTWLDRAGASTLFVSILPEDGDHPIPFDQIVRVRARNPLFRQLRHNSLRWRELEIVRRLEDFPVLLHRDDPWHIPELVKLTMRLPNGGRHPTQFPPNMLSILLDAPALREVHLMGFTPHNLLIPWSQLTTVHVENTLPVECLQILSHTTNIVTGRFSIWPTQFAHLPNNAPDACPGRLKSLTISGELCTEILAHLELPALQRFSLTIGPNNDFAPLTAFLARGVNLKDVALEVRGAVPAGDFIGCLEVMLTVEALEFSVHTGLMNGPLPHALQTNSALLPNLRHLTIKEMIDRYNEPPLNEAVVVEMLQARWAGGLKSFRLVSTHVFRTIHPGFATLAQEGMGIELRSHGLGPFLTVYFNSPQDANGKGKERAEDV